MVLKPVLTCLPHRSRQIVFSAADRVEQHVDHSLVCLGIQRRVLRLSVDSLLAPTLSYCSSPVEILQRSSADIIRPRQGLLGRLINISRKRSSESGRHHSRTGFASIIPFRHTPKVAPRHTLLSKTDLLLVPSHRLSGCTEGLQ